MRKSHLPTFLNGVSTDGEVIIVGTPYWYNKYLPSIYSFRYQSNHFMPITVSRKKNKPYWNAYRRINGVLKCKYVGKHEDVSYEKLEMILEDLNPQPKSYLTLRWL